LCWYSFEISLLRMAKVLTCPKPTRNTSRVRVWRSAGVLRHGMRGKRYVEELVAKGFE
jgi:hypothetical protein